MVILGLGNLNQSVMPATVSTQNNYQKGDIVTAIFYNESQRSNRVASLANGVWFDLPDELAKYTGSPYSIDIKEQGAEEIAKQMKVKKIPAIVFMEKKDGNQWETKTTLTGNVPKKAIEATYFRVINKIYGRGDNALAKLESEHGLIKGDDGSGLFPAEIVRLGMQALTGFALYQTVEAEDNVKRAGYGALATYGAYQLFRKGSTTIDFE